MSFFSSVSRKVKLGVVAVATVALSSAMLMPNASAAGGFPIERTKVGYCKTGNGFDYDLKVYNGPYSGGGRNVTDVKFVNNEKGAASVKATLSLRKTVLPGKPGATIWSKGSATYKSGAVVTVGSSRFSTTDVVTLVATVSPTTGKTAGRTCTISVRLS